MLAGGRSGGTPAAGTALLLLLAACGAEPAKDFTGRDFPGPGYRIDFPAGWEERTGEHDLDRVAICPPMGDHDVYHENIGVLRETLDREMPLAVYADRALGRLAEEQPLSVVDDRVALDLGGRPALRIDCRWLGPPERDRVRRPLPADGFGRYFAIAAACLRPEGAIVLRGRCWIMIAGRSAYLVNATAPAATFSRQEADFERCAASFRWE
jgi:hypothetical protein